MVIFSRKDGYIRCDAHFGPDEFETTDFPGLDFEQAVAHAAERFGLPTVDAGGRSVFKFSEIDISQSPTSHPGQRAWRFENLIQD